MDPVALALGFGGPLAFGLVAGRFGRVGAAVGVVAGWVFGVVALVGLPPIPPVEAFQWLVPAAVVALLWGALPALPRVADLAARAVLLAALLHRMLAPMVEYSWSGGVAAAWIGGLALAGAATWAGYDAVVERVPARASLAGLAVWAGGLGVALAATGSVKFGMLGGALGLAVLGVAIAALTGGRSEPRGLVPAVAVVGLGMIVAGAFFASTPPLVAVALAAAPAALLLARGDAARIPWRAPLVVAVPMVAAVLAGAWLTGAFEAEDEMGDYRY